MSIDQDTFLATPAEPGTFAIWASLARPLSCANRLSYRSESEVRKDARRVISWLHQVFDVAGTGKCHVAPVTTAGLMDPFDSPNDEGLIVFFPDGSVDRDGAWFASWAEFVAASPLIEIDGQVLVDRS
jgi:hypothetical protein